MAGTGNDSENDDCPRCRHFDVVIIGGAFSGSAMGLLLRRAMPEARVAIVERSTKFDRKVGESTSEVAGCFLTRVLGLSRYLSQHHIAKNGLRMWFNDGANESMGRCSEIGGRLQTRLPGFQLDRSELDPHLLHLAQEAGCEVFRPATVRDLELGGAGSNRMRIDLANGERVEVTAGWVVDASGKASVIPRLRGTLETLEEEHPTTSVWARFRKVGDLDGHETLSRFPEMRDAVLSARGTATNHLMGRGWWCWIIPLRDGDVSAGITYDRRLFELPEGGTLTDRLHRHLLSHPVGRELFQNAEPVEKDTRTYTQLAYRAREVGGDGWLVVGDACGFMDPLYSQGLDYCSHTVFTAHRIVLKALADDDASAAVANYNRQFEESYGHWFRALYREKYRYLGDAELMFTAFLLDLSLYFLGPVRLVYTDGEVEFAKLPYEGKAGEWVARFMAFYNRRLARLADARLASGTYGRRNLDYRFILRQGMAPGMALAPLILRALGHWARAEWHGISTRHRTEEKSAPISPVMTAETTPP